MAVLHLYIETHLDINEFIMSLTSLNPPFRATGASYHCYLQSSQMYCRK